MMCLVNVQVYSHFDYIMHYFLVISTSFANVCLRFDFFAVNLEKFDPKEEKVFELIALGK